MNKEISLSPSLLGRENPSISFDLVEQPHYDAAQKLTWKEPGADGDYQSLLNVQNRRSAPYRAVKNEHIQLLHDGSGHYGYLFFVSVEGSRYNMV